MSVGAALIGASGMWGPRVGAAVERGSGLRLVTCCARDGEKLRAFAAEHGTEPAESFRADAATQLTLHTRDGRQPIEFDHRDPLAEELDELAGAVSGTAEPETGAEEGIAALRVILEALR